MDQDDSAASSIPRARGGGADLLGILTLLGLVLLGLACWWLVPWFMHLVKHQDCIGSGATNC